MAGIVERDQSLKRESLSDLMTIVDKKLPIHVAG